MELKESFLEVDPLYWIELSFSSLFSLILCSRLTAVARNSHKLRHSVISHQYEWQTVDVFAIVAQLLDRCIRASLFSSRKQMKRRFRRKSYLVQQPPSTRQTQLRLSQQNLEKMQWQLMGVEASTVDEDESFFHFSLLLIFNGSEALGFASYKYHIYMKNEFKMIDAWAEAGVGCNLAASDERTKVQTV